MAGSQLKKLKATLKAAGLTGQTNSKKKGKKHSRKTPNETRKEDRRQMIEEIREEFNPFDVKMTKSKREDARSKNMTVGKPGITKQIGEERRKAEWDAKRARKNKTGGIMDRRFGESNSDMTAEEKMLERFTKERLAHSSKRGLFNLEDDEDDEGGESLTHFGQSLAFDGARAVSDEDEDDEDDDGFFNKKGAPEHDETDEPPRKKTKAEVMKEVIAKSKFYRAQRQKEAKELQEKVSELDDDFQDVMDDIIDSKPKEKTVQKTETDVEYEKKVKSIALDRRAAPADREKTIEEIAKEKKDNLERLEQARLLRMQARDEHGEDDLDDEFWAGSDEDEATGFTIKESDAEDDDEEEEEEVEEDENEDDEEKPASGDRPSTIRIGNKVISVGSSDNATLTCPQEIDEFLKLTQGRSHDDVVDLIKRIFKKYQPRLGAGNKEKIGQFTRVLIEYLLRIADEDTSGEGYTHLFEFLSQLIRDLAAKYPEQMLEEFRLHMNDIHERINSRDPEQYPKKSDLVLYATVGRTFSTSDLYHLIGTPIMVLLGESLEFMKIDKHITHLFSGLFICDLLLQYQRVAKRVVPEVNNFLERAILTLAQEPQQIDPKDLLTRSKKQTKTKFTLPASAELPESLPLLHLSEWDEVSEEQRANLLLKALQLLDRYTSEIFKETDAFIEISKPFIPLLKHLAKYHAANPKVPALLKKLTNVNRVAVQEREPLMLQGHRPLAIATYAPKFEENYNPDKKFYDTDRARQEINKLRHQIKEETKQNMREIRRDTKFEARQQIEAKKQFYQDYHDKMARIINQVQTEEGTAKNEYEREKRKRK